jgi:hypothetical protein
VRRGGAAILVLLTLIFCGKDAFALCRATTSREPVTDADGCATDGIPLYWKSQCVGFHIDAAASSHLGLEDATSLMVQGFSLWTAAGGACVPSITVVPLAPATSPKLGYETNAANENDIVFHDDSWPYDPTSLDFTGATFEDQTGEIIDVDLEINGTSLPTVIGLNDGGPVNPFDSRGAHWLFAHVAGHFLGFGHSPDLNSVMYPQFSPGDDRIAALTAEDAAVMCAAYPPGGGRATSDAKGRAVVVPSSACNLAAASGGGSCSSSGVRLDNGYGCAFAPRRMVSRAETRWLSAAFAAALLLSRATPRARARTRLDPWRR